MTSDPHDLSPEIKDASAWYGPGLAARAEWIEHLSASEIAEVETAVKRLEDASLDLRWIERGDFPLPTLAPRLHSHSEPDSFLVIRSSQTSIPQNRKSSK